MVQNSVRSVDKYKLCGELLSANVMWCQIVIKTVKNSRILDQQQELATVFALHCVLQGETRNKRERRKRRRDIFKQPYLYNYKEFNIWSYKHTFSGYHDLKIVTIFLSIIDVQSTCTTSLQIDMKMNTFLSIQPKTYQSSFSSILLLTHKTSQQKLYKFSLYLKAGVL